MSNEQEPYLIPPRPSATPPNSGGEMICPTAINESAENGRCSEQARQLKGVSTAQSGGESRADRERDGT